METQYISLNMTPTGVNPCFHISQYDVGRMLGFIVHSGGATVDLDTYTCTIEATRSDGTAITSAVATTDNIGTFEVTPTMSNKADKYRCQLIIVDENSKRIASLPFDMEVTKAAMDENSEAIEEDASLYQQYTEAVQGAIAEANAGIQAEENARIAAVNAEATARQNADATLQNNIDAEATARQSADNTLQGNINSEASTRASADSNLQSQINQIIAPSGEAPSAAEVQNARIGDNGVTYDTLGDAIRGQVTDLKSALCKYGIGNLASSYGVLSDRTDHEVAITVNNDGSFILNGTANGNALFNILASTASLPEWQKAGGKYYAGIQCSNSAVKLQVIAYKGNAFEAIFDKNGEGTYTIAPDKTGIWIRIYVASGTALSNQKGFVYIFGQKSNEMLEEYTDARISDVNTTIEGVSSRNNNLVNQDGNRVKPKVGFYRWDNGVYSNTSGKSCTPVYDAEPGTEYILENNDATIFSLVFYNNGVFAFGKGNVTIDKKITVPSNANQFALSFTTEYSGYVYINSVASILNKEHIQEISSSNYELDSKEFTKSTVLQYNSVLTDKIKQYRKVKLSIDNYVSTGFTVTGRLYLLKPGNVAVYLTDTISFADDYSVECANLDNNIVGYGIRIDTTLSDLPSDFKVKLICSGMEYTESLHKIRSDVDKLSVKRINCFGDSITQSGNSTAKRKTYPAQLQQLVGDEYIVSNYGVNGASIANVAGRMCAIPMFLNDDIVFEEGETTFSTSDGTLFKSGYPSFENPRPAALINPAGYDPDYNPCYIDGHKCNISISLQDVLTIELTDGSSGITLHKGSRLYFRGGIDARNGMVNIVMMGTNGMYTDATDYVNQYKKVAEYCGKGNYLFLSQFDVHFTSNGTYAAYKTAQLAKLSDLIANEEAMENAFGNRFINMRKELVLHGLEYAVEAGLFPVTVLSHTNNVDAIENGIVPFGADFDGTTVSDYHNGLLFNVHPNDIGNYAIAKIVQKHLVALGYFE